MNKTTTKNTHETDDISNNIGLKHRLFRDDEFWQEIPAWSGVSRRKFSDHMWQLKNSVHKIAELPKLLKDRIPQKNIS